MADLSSSAELLCRLLAFDTQSFRSNLDLVGFVQAHLDGLGVASRLIATRAARRLSGR
ncbi:MAG: hypothetical protein U1E17_08465 [Geminicoccaceae bacterium]